MINELHERHLHWIIKLLEYKGLQGPGIRQGKSNPIALDAPDSRDMVTIMLDDMQDGLVDDKDRLVGNIEALDLFVDNIED